MVHLVTFKIHFMGYLAIFFRIVQTICQKSVFAFFPYSVFSFLLLFTVFTDRKLLAQPVFSCLKSAMGKHQCNVWNLFKVKCHLGLQSQSVLFGYAYWWIVLKHEVYNNDWHIHCFQLLQVHIDVPFLDSSYKKEEKTEKT